MSSYEQQYLDTIRTILNKGTWEYNSRTDTRCLTIPRLVMEYTLDSKSMPLLTTRPSYPISAVAEILGYLRRYTNAQQFAEIGSPTWFKNANETQAWVGNPYRKGGNDLGLVYGAALSEEYISNILNQLVLRRDDRGLKLDWWQPDSFDKSALRPCLSDHQFMIVGETLNLTSNQRSTDFMCGKNFNALQVYFLGMLGCKLSGLEGGTALHVMNHVHIYENHLEGVEELLTRKPSPVKVNFSINENVELALDVLEGDRHAKEYFKLGGYKGVAQPRINFEMVA